ncbi:hypothetical protein, conserved in T.vivax [Trypanosoma vivax Y486]|uniref:Uncharacterized protein n=1 Tax=Trypanosoma vivax (strain Y486) TaxID=1055687 RepID=F9WPF8_TRYVY|nr:hypothetical protein, conserved in T.vivax [Trypanosoma vivax Y486]|eukprot:CCD19435.1 hypothetical protein, conserved in T.vivax [Trypanosoma vivax Y486]
MFKPFFLCTAAWCAFCLATAHGQETWKSVGYSEMDIDCHEKTKEKEYQINQTKLFGHYNFSCIKESGETRVGLSVEGTDTRKKLSGLGGSSAWCHYDGKVDKKSFKCTERRARSMIHIPKDACTLYVQNNGTLWFSAKVEEKKNITCNTSGLFRKLQYSFKATEGNTDKVTLHVSEYASESLLSFITNPTSGAAPSSHPAAPEVEVKQQASVQVQNGVNGHGSSGEIEPAIVQKPKETKGQASEIKQQPSTAHVSPSRQVDSDKPVVPSKPVGTDKPAGKPGGTQNGKPGDASESTGRPEESGKGSRDTATEPEGIKTAEAEASRGHTNAAVALSLPMLLVHSFAA